MSKKRKSKEAKRDRREHDLAEREAAERTALRRQKVMRIVVIGVPIVTLAAALTTWAVTKDVRTAALVGLLGVGIWVPLLLGGVGAAVRPRDRNRAGSIDFGNRR